VFELLVAGVDFGEGPRWREWAVIPGTAPDGCAQDSEGAIWFSDAVGSQVVWVLEGGQVTHRIATPQPTLPASWVDQPATHCLC
jgi:sugar lactone lactonase YvrE